jgi:hypothetical protein
MPCPRHMARPPTRTRIRLRPSATPKQWSSDSSPGNRPPIPLGRVRLSVARGPFTAKINPRHPLHLHRARPDGITTARLPRTPAIPSPTLASGSLSWGKPSGTPENSPAFRCSGHRARPCHLVPPGRPIAQGPNARRTIFDESANYRYSLSGSPNLFSSGQIK